MNERYVDHTVGAMLEKIRVKNVDYGDTKDWDDLTVALSGSSKNNSGQSGLVDVSGRVGRYAIIVEDKLRFERQCSWSKDSNPYTSNCDLNRSDLPTKNFAENGAYQYIEFASRQWPKKSDVDCILSFGISMDDEKNIIIRPFFSRVHSGRIVRLPVWDDFSILKSETSINKYIERSEDAPGCLADAVGALGKLKMADLDKKLAVALLAMGNPGFSRNGHSGHIHECASFWSSRTTFCHLSYDASRALNKLVNRFGKTKDVAEITSLVDRSIVTTEHYYELYRAMTSDVPLAAMALGAISEIGDRDRVLFPWDNNPFLLAEVERARGGDGRNTELWCSDDGSCAECLSAALFSGITKVNAMTLSELPYNYKDTKFKPHAVVADIRSDMEDYEYLETAMDWIKGGSMAYFITSVDLAKSPAMKDDRASILKHYSLKRLVVGKDWCVMAVLKKSGDGSTIVSDLRRRNEGNYEDALLVKNSRKVKLTADNWCIEIPKKTHKRASKTK